jgi:formylglycine-generating enzyme required for sulfatase activity/pectate lyase
VSAEKKLGGFVVVLIALLAQPTAVTSAAETALDSGKTLLLAFPGAEGFGACIPGGRGGKVYVVTTLEDYTGRDKPIEGSLRAAVRAKGPRTVVFGVSGNIHLKEDLAIEEPFITLAGQTAPGDGVCIQDRQVILTTHDIIIRHLRFRTGEAAREDLESLAVFGGHDFIVDHCSCSWATDEVHSSFGPCRNITVQWSIIAECLSASVHPKGPHSKGSILSGDGGMTYHHDVYAHNDARNPRVDEVVMDFRNNVVYDWGYRCGYTREGSCFLNYVNNYIKPGLSTRPNARTSIFALGDEIPRVFVSGNILNGFPEQTRNNGLLIIPPSKEFRDRVLVKEPFPCPAVRTESAEAALESVLAGVGATLPKRDSADIRLMNEIRTGTGRIIDSTKDVGGWPDLKSAPAPKDTDKDGMPDEWETAHGLNPNDPGDNVADADGDGYTNIEEYINATDPRQPEQGCRVDAKAFRQLQDDALALVIQGKEAFVRKQLEDKKKRREEIAQIIKTLKVTINEAPQTDHKRIIVKLGDAGVEMEMVGIPAGSFMMGSPEGEGGRENERPQHKVNISRPFYMAATVLTAAQYQAVFGAAGRKRDPNSPAPVNWYQGMDLCEILSAATGRTFRLPTEAEWEYACRARTTTAFNTGDTITTDQANFSGTEATRYNPIGINRGKTVSVRQFPPNAWGLYEMHGNTYQYCLDCAGAAYTKEEVTDPLCTIPNEAHVMRGGSDGSKSFYLRSAARYNYLSSIEYAVRCIMEAK